jgi:hypothetical protein
MNTVSFFEYLNKRAMMALYRSTAEKKAETNFSACANT